MVDGAVLPNRGDAIRMARDLPAAGSRSIRTSGASAESLAPCAYRFIGSGAIHDQETTRLEFDSAVHANCHDQRRVYVATALGIDVRDLATVRHSTVRHGCQLFTHLQE